jgi:hypothetical protein
MKGVLILAVVLPLLAGGCASEWLVDISTKRIEVESSNSSELTATSALKLFSDVANQLGLDIRGPVPQPSGNESVIQYDAIAQNKTNLKDNAYLSLDLYITKSAIIMYCRSDQSSADAQRAASIIERALDERVVRYNVSTRTGSFFN